MNLPLKELGEKLKLELNAGYNKERISNWAFELLSYTRDLDSDSDYILNVISAISEGPEFEYTEKELNLLAELLIKGEDDPIGKIEGMNKP
jgi:hypothetical protein